MYLEDIRDQIAGQLIKEIGNKSSTRDSEILLNELDFLINIANIERS